MRWHDLFIPVSKTVCIFKCVSHWLRLKPDLQLQSTGAARPRSGQGGVWSRINNEKNKNMGLNGSMQFEAHTQMSLSSFSHWRCSTTSTNHYSKIRCLLISSRFVSTCFKMPRSKLQTSVQNQKFLPWQPLHAGCRTVTQASQSCHPAAWQTWGFKGVIWEPNRESKWGHGCSVEALV